MSSKDIWLEVDDLVIRYRTHRIADQTPRARVLILPGFTEFVEKHAQTMTLLADMQLESLVLDWPGQGRSTRLTRYANTLIHSDGFEQHLACLNAVARKEGFTDDGDVPLFLFGHSMGGHLAMRQAAEYMPRCAGVVITAPMILPPVRPAGLVLLLAQMFCGLGFARYPVLFRHQAPRGPDFYPENKLTRDPEGYAVQPMWWARDPRLNGYGASFGWVRAAYASCLATTADRDWMKRFPLPLSAHIAGDERIVDDATIRQMLPLVPGAEVYDYPDARHELLLELPEVRAALWQRVADFISARC